MMNQRVAPYEKSIVVLDEAHLIITANTGKTELRKFSELATTASCVILCTATPLWSAGEASTNQAELFNYGRILNQFPITNNYRSGDKEDIEEEIKFLLYGRVDGRKLRKDVDKTLLDKHKVTEEVANATGKAIIQYFTGISLGKKLVPTFKTKIANILKNEGFIKDFKVSSEEKKQMLSYE